MVLLQNGMRMEQNQKRETTITANKMVNGFGIGKVE